MGLPIPPTPHARKLPRRDQCGLSAPENPGARPKTVLFHSDAVVRASLQRATKMSPFHCSFITTVVTISGRKGGGQTFIWSWLRSVGGRGRHNS